MVNGYYDYNFFIIYEWCIDYFGEVVLFGQVCQCVYCVCVKCVVLVVGVYEWLLVYGNNDLFGNMFVGVVFIYVWCYGVVLGKKLVLVINNDYVYCVVFDWQEVGL